MFAMTDAERAAMGAASRKCFEERFDLEKNALYLLHVIERASSGKAAKSDVRDR
jgi:hypothetical protein